MRRLVWLVSLLALGCQRQPASLIVVDVYGGSPVVGNNTVGFSVTATADRTVTFSIQHGPVLYPTSFGVEVPAPYAGPVSLRVTATGYGDQPLGTGEGDTTVSPGETSHVTITVGSTPDGGADGAVDGGADMANGYLNGPGERCFGCQHGLICAPGSGARYCLYPCTSQLDCTVQTQCTAVTNLVGTVFMACEYVSSDLGAQPNGAPCSQGADHCMPGYLCGAAATCDRQCDGPADHSCATGTCKPLVDPQRLKTLAYTCQP